MGGAPLGPRHRLCERPPVIVYCCLAIRPVERSFLVPAVSILRETGTLYTYDAETLARRRLHHHPALQPAHHRGTQLLQACHFGRDVVSLDVYVNATLVAHPLDLDD